MTGPSVVLWEPVLHIAVLVEVDNVCSLDHNAGAHVAHRSPLSKAAWPLCHKNHTY